jgi:TolB protein
VRGIFSTRIAYVKVKAAHSYELVVADADGESEQVAASAANRSSRHRGRRTAPRSPTSRSNSAKPVIYVQNLVTGARTVIANEKGSNSAPAWSPDGTKLALALSKTAIPRSYIVNADGSGLRRLSNSNGIDTEPQFSADGQSIYFTSDRSGGPQIYKMSAERRPSHPRHLQSGSYNISPRISPDGKTLAWISQRDGGLPTCTRWTWPAARNSAWPMGPRRTEFFA